MVALVGEIRMLSVREAEAIALRCAPPLDRERDAERVGLEAAAGRILAAPVTGVLDFPHWDNSAMDGYAVRSADLADCSPQAPAPLEVVETIPAGSQPQRALGGHQAARLYTGSLLPAGADAIVPQERIQRDGDRIRVEAPIEPQAFVRRRASFHRAGEPLLAAGTRLGPAEVALLAAAQCQQVAVYRRPQVAILSTGDELVPPHQLLQPGQIVDSNQYALASFVADCGAVPQPLGIVPDRPEALQSAIAQAIASADLVLSTGGVSVGDHDYIERVLTALGGQLQFRTVTLKPGKPLTLATFAAHDSGRECCYFGLPGNPVSALVSCWRLVRPALLRRSGWAQAGPAQFAAATTRSELRAGGGRETYLWGQLERQAGGPTFALNPGHHDSANLVNLAQTDALAVVPVGTTHIPAGRSIEVLPV